MIKSWLSHCLAGVVCGDEAVGPYSRALPGKANRVDSVSYLRPSFLFIFYFIFYPTLFLYL